MRITRLVERLRSALWFLPGVFLVAAIAQALLIPELEERSAADSSQNFLFEGGPDGARVLLSMVAGSCLTLMVLVFSITIVALQLASSQFSPRVLRTFLRDWYSQVALGVFTATFAYSITVLRAVRSAEGGNTEFVPRLAVAVAFFWAIASVITFVLYVHHTASSLRVVSVIERVGRETRATIAKEFPDRPDPGWSLAVPDRGCGRVVTTLRSGAVTDLDLDALVRLAERADTVIELAVPVGDFVPVHAPLAWVHGSGEVDHRALVRAIGMASERTMLQDVRFGFRQLVDIAERALSPAINDPTTAVQSLGEIHDLLRRLASAPWPSGRHAGPSGRLRVIVPQPTWDQILELAVDEIRLAGEGAIQVERRLQRLLTDLASAVPEERRAVVDEELRLLECGVQRALADPHDRAQALTSP